MLFLDSRPWWKAEAQRRSRDVWSLKREVRDRKSVLWSKNSLGRGKKEWESPMRRPYGRECSQNRERWWGNREENVESRMGKSHTERWGGTDRTWWQELPGANEEKMKGRGNFQTSGRSKQWPESGMNRIQDALWSYYPRVSPRLAVLTSIGSLLEIRTCQSRLTYWIRICIFTRSPEIQICTRILEAPLSIYQWLYTGMTVY